MDVTPSKDLKGTAGEEEAELNARLITADFRKAVIDAASRALQGYEMLKQDHFADDFVHERARAVTEQLERVRARIIKIGMFGGDGSGKSTTAVRILFPQLPSDDQVLRNARGYGHVTKVVIAVRKVAAPSPPRPWNPARNGEPSKIDRGGVFDFYVEHQEEDFYVTLVERMLHNKAPPDPAAFAADYFCSYEPSPSAGGRAVVALDRAAMGRAAGTESQLKISEALIIKLGQWAQPAPGHGEMDGVPSDVVGLRQLSTYLDLRAAGSKSKRKGVLTPAQALMIKCVHFSSWSACIPEGWELWDLLGYVEAGTDGEVREDTSLQVKKAVEEMNIVVACTNGRCLKPFRVVDMYKAGVIHPLRVPIILVPVFRRADEEAMFPVEACKKESHAAFVDAITNLGKAGIQDLSYEMRARLLDNVEKAILYLFIRLPDVDDDDDVDDEYTAPLLQFDGQPAEAADPNRNLMGNIRGLVDKAYIVLVAIACELGSAMRLSTGRKPPKMVYKKVSDVIRKKAAFKNVLYFGPAETLAEEALLAEVADICSKAVEFATDSGSRDADKIARATATEYQPRLAVALRSFIEATCRACTLHAISAMEARFTNLSSVIKGLPKDSSPFHEEVDTGCELLKASFQRKTDEFIAETTGAVGAAALVQESLSRPFTFQTDGGGSLCEKDVLDIMVHVLHSAVPACLVVDSGETLAASKEANEQLVDTLVDQLWQEFGFGEASSRGTRSSKTPLYKMNRFALRSLQKRLAAEEGNVLTCIAEMGKKAPTARIRDCLRALDDKLKLPSCLREVTRVAAKVEHGVRTCSAPSLYPLRVGKRAPPTPRHALPTLRARERPVQLAEKMPELKAPGKFARASVTVPLALRPITFKVSSDARRIVGAYNEHVKLERGKYVAPVFAELPPLFVLTCGSVSQLDDKRSRCISLYKDLHCDGQVDALSSRASLRVTPIIFVVSAGEEAGMERKLTEAQFDAAHVIILSVTIDKVDAPAEADEIVAGRLELLGSAPAMLEAIKTMAEFWFDKDRKDHGLNSYAQSVTKIREQSMTALKVTVPSSLSRALMFGQSMLDVERLDIARKELMEIVKDEKISEINKMVVNYAMSGGANSEATNDFQNVFTEILKEARRLLISIDKERQRGARLNVNSDMSTFDGHLAKLPAEICEAVEYLKAARRRIDLVSFASYSPTEFMVAVKTHVICKNNAGLEPRNSSLEARKEYTHNGPHSKAYSTICINSIQTQAPFSYLDGIGSFLASDGGLPKRLLKSIDEFGRVENPDLFWWRQVKFAEDLFHHQNACYGLHGFNTFNFGTSQGADGKPAPAVAAESSESEDDAEAGANPGANPGVSTPAAKKRAVEGGSWIFNVLPAGMPTVTQVAGGELTDFWKSAAWQEFITSRVWPWCALLQRLDRKLRAGYQVIAEVKRDGKYVVYVKKNGTGPKTLVRWVDAMNEWPTAVGAKQRFRAQRKVPETWDVLLQVPVAVPSPAPPEFGTSGSAVAPVAVTGTHLVIKDGAGDDLARLPVLDLAAMVDVIRHAGARAPDPYAFPGLDGRRGDDGDSALDPVLQLHAESAGLVLVDVKADGNSLPRALAEACNDAADVEGRCPYHPPAGAPPSGRGGRTTRSSTAVARCGPWCRIRHDVCRHVAHVATAAGLESPAAADAWAAARDTDGERLGLDFVMAYAHMRGAVGRLGVLLMADGALAVGRPTHAGGPPLDGFDFFVARSDCGDEGEGGGGHYSAAFAPAN